MNIQENISLKPYNTFGIEASSKLFSDFNSVRELQEILDSPYKTEPRLVLGGGSNILLTQNFNGLTLRNNLKGIEVVKEDDSHVWVKSQGGENWHDFVLWCIDNNFAGIENMSLIPGSVGASPMQNIGAYGVEIKDVFEELEALNIGTLKVEKFSHSDCNFGYRESVFKRALKNKYIIISVTYKLNKKPVFNTSYGAIEAELERMNVQDLSIKAISNAVINIRSSKLPDPKEIGNSGSFFKNPVIDNNLFEQVKASHPNVANYPAGEGKTKLAAGWLIDQAGWKGKTINNYGVHKNQALVLVNYGGATGQEIYNLSTEIIESIKEKYGVELEREVNII